MLTFDLFELIICALATPAWETSAHFLYATLFF